MLNYFVFVIYQAANRTRGKTQEDYVRSTMGIFAAFYSAVLAVILIAQFAVLRRLIISSYVGLPILLFITGFLVYRLCARQYPDERIREIVKQYEGSLSKGGAMALFYVLFMVIMAGVIALGYIMLLQLMRK